MAQSGSLNTIINEEYKVALHSRSYLNLYSKAHHHEEKEDGKKEGGGEEQADFLLEPSPKTLNNSCTSDNLKLLLDFFDTTQQSSIACIAVLSLASRARTHHASIHRLLLDLSSTSSPSTVSQLSSHLELDNPLSARNLSLFHLTHALYPALIHRLNSASSGRRWFGGWRRLEREKAKIDAAAKGAYIIGRDLDTVSMMVKRVRDEVEHGRDVARMVVRNVGELGMVREVVREMEVERGEVGLGLEEQLEELEEHVYLCLNTINRSRRLVAGEMME